MDVNAKKLITDLVWDNFSVEVEGEWILIFNISF